MNLAQIRFLGTIHDNQNWRHIQHHLNEIFTHGEWQKSWDADEYVNYSPMFHRTCILDKVNLLTN